MNLTIPLYVSRERGPGGDRFFARPLFFDSPVRSGERLDRVLSRLAGDIRDVQLALSKSARHDEWAEWLFHPRLHESRQKIVIQLRRRTVSVKVTFFEFPAFERTIVFCPQLPDLWFDRQRGESLSSRAKEVFEDYWREREKLDDDHWEGALEHLAKARRCWVHPLELDVAIPPPKLQEERRLVRFASLAEEVQMSGDEELRKVGRCLDWLFPDDLDRAVLRDSLADELQRSLEDFDVRPVVLVGPRSVGKTSVIHEVVARRVLSSGRRYSYGKNVWLISPQRLISGMSYVGQWEQRLTAILDESKKRNHVLYFDDFLGLYRAGISADSDLAAAQVVKPYAHRRDVRIVAELTDESWAVLQEKDRGFADLFHVIRVDEPCDDDVFRILVRASRELERRYSCRFDLEVLPSVVDLQRSYQPDSAFPGKSCVFLRRLALKFQRQSISRKEVLESYRETSGLSVSFLDTQELLPHDEIRNGLSARVIGQVDAVEAMASAVSVARARLNDPSRPFATFLFLGPTGVGKTECAKALAEYLFGSEERLLRFDMNECVTPDAVARLIGISAQPDGHLTGAVRRQPFSVVLFDEIEKGHPDVFDLLLQVLGEGRLTDSLVHRPPGELRVGTSGRLQVLQRTVISHHCRLCTHQVVVELG
ncbi:MAG: AAA family ATPase, partial [Planctomycetota bacterium]